MDPGADRPRNQPRSLPEWPGAGACRKRNTVRHLMFFPGPPACLSASRNWHAGAANGSPPNNATSAPGPARRGTAIRPASRPRSGITEILKAEFTGRIIPSGSMDASGFPLAPQRAVKFQTRTDRGSFLNVDGFTPKTRWNARRKLRASAYPILAAIASTGSP